MFMMCRISFGILFHSLGAMLEKALSPYVFVRDLGSSNSFINSKFLQLASRELASVWYTSILIQRCEHITERNLKLPDFQVQ